MKQSPRTSAILGLIWSLALVACRPASVDEAQARAHAKACAGGDAKGCSDLVALYTEACEKGVGAGCVKLGEIVANGAYDQSRDEPRAGTLFAKACTGGDGVGCSRLAALTERGRGVPADPARAVELYVEATRLHTKGCERGDARECGHLGVLVLLGRGTGDKDEQRAAPLLSRGCGAGNGAACDHLGAVHEGRASRAVLEDEDNAEVVSLFRQAMSSFTAACEAGDLGGCGHRGRLLTQGQPGIDKDEILGQTLLMDACKGGDAASCRAIAHRLLGPGTGTEDTSLLASVHLTMACDRDDLEGCVDLGGLLERGRGADKDEARAAALYTRACDGGEASGCGKLARLLEAGRGVGKDEARAASLFSRACDRGRVEDCNHHGRLLEEGRGVGKDEARAATLYARICETLPRLRSIEPMRPYATGCFNLGRLLEEGRGVGKDAARAAAAFDKACAGGEVQGCARKLAADGDPVSSTGNIANASAVVAGMAPGFRRCYNLGLRDDPKLEGSARITARIGTNGEVTATSAASRGNLSESVIACLQKRVSSAQFAPPEGGGATIVIPVTLTQK